MNRTLPYPLVGLMLAFVLVLLLNQYWLFLSRRMLKSMPPSLREKHLPELLRLQKRQVYIEATFVVVAFGLIAVTLWGPDWLFLPLREWLEIKPLQNK